MASQTLHIDHSGNDSLKSQIHDRLLEQIEDGSLEHNTRLPSMRRLSEETGVSIGIIRQAIGSLTHSGHLRVDARRGVYVSRPHLRVADLALVLPTVQSHFVPALMDGVLGGLRGTQYRMVVESAHSSFREEVRLLERLDRAFLAGVLVSPPPFVDDAQVIRDLVDRGLPCVQLMVSVDEQASPSVTVDDYEMGRLAVELLLEQGHRKIAILGTNAEGSSAETLRAGLDAGLAAGGLSLATIPLVRGDAEQLDPDHPFEASEESARYLLNKYPDTTAIIGTTPNRAIGACRVAVSEGRSVPEDFSIVGVGGDTAIAALTGPGITTIDRPARAIGQRAALMLRQMIDGRHLAQANIQLQPVVYRRQSVASPRATPRGV